MLSKLSIPTPSIHNPAAINENILGTCLCIAQKMYGTIITFIAVKNALLLAVVSAAPDI